MGGATFTLEGKTKEEVSKKLKNSLQDALYSGLVEERRTVIKFERAKGVWVAYLSLHT